jgi:hypothetical protein
VAAPPPTAIEASPTLAPPGKGVSTGAPVPALPLPTKPTLTLRVFVEGFAKHLTTVLVLAEVSLHRLRGLLHRIPLVPKHYRFLHSDKVR